MRNHKIGEKEKERKKKEEEKKKEEKEYKENENENENRTDLKQLMMQNIASLTSVAFSSRTLRMQLYVLFQASHGAAMRSGAFKA